MDPYKGPISLKCKECLEVLLPSEEDMIFFEEPSSGGIHLGLRGDCRSAAVEVIEQEEHPSKKAKSSARPKLSIAKCLKCSSKVGSLISLAGKQELCFKSSTTVLIDSTKGPIGPSKWTKIAPHTPTIRVSRVGSGDSGSGSASATTTALNDTNTTNTTTKTNTNTTTKINTTAKTNIAEKIKPKHPKPTTKQIQSNIYKVTRTKPRPYQIECAVAAMQQNSIIYLPTGAGKTLVAALVIGIIRAAAATTENSDAKFIFLVDRIPLAYQQATYLAKELGSTFRILCVTGQNSASFPDVANLPKHDILVITAQVFLNWKDRHLPSDDVALTIFDEIHHATNRHPYVEILRRTTEGSKLGLTASPITGDLLQMTAGLEELERLSSCKVYLPLVQYRNLEASISSPAIHLHPIEEDDSFVKTVEDQITQYCRKVLKEDYFFATTSTSATTTTTSLQDIKAGISYLLEKEGSPQSFLLSHLISCLEVNQVLGPSFALSHCREIFQHAQMDIPFDFGDDLSAPTFQPIPTTKTPTTISTTTTPTVTKPKTSKKLQKLLQILKEKEGSGGRAIVFVETKQTARLLTTYLKEVDKDIAEQGRKWRPATLVGSSGHQALDGMLWKSEQGPIIRRFRSGYHRLLVSTSVLEEGIDVPVCDLVIVFDHSPKREWSLARLIQSRGRARSRQSEYHVIALSAVISSFSSVLQKELLMKKIIVRSVKDGSTAVPKPLLLERFLLSFQPIPAVLLDVVGVEDGDGDGDDDYFDDDSKIKKKTKTVCIHNLSKGNMDDFLFKGRKMILDLSEQEYRERRMINDASCLEHEFATALIAKTPPPPSSLSKIGLIEKNIYNGNSLSFGSLVEPTIMDRCSFLHVEFCLSLSGNAGVVELYLQVQNTTFRFLLPTGPFVIWDPLKAIVVLPLPEGIIGNVSHTVEPVGSLWLAAASNPSSQFRWTLSTPKSLPKSLLSLVNNHYDCWVFHLYPHQKDFVLGALQTTKLLTTCNAFTVRDVSGLMTAEDVVRFGDYLDGFDGVYRALVLCSRKGFLNKVTFDDFINHVRRYDGGDGGIVPADGVVLAKATTTTTKPKYIRVRCVVITPLGVAFEEEKVMCSNRVLRNFDPEYFLKVQFRSTSSNNPDRRSKLTTSKDDLTEVMGAILDILNNGLKVGGRRYDLLAMSSSQLRDHDCWMVSPHFKDNDNDDNDELVMIDAAYIRRWLGDFSSIRNVAKYIARLGQSLSSSEEVFKVADSSFSVIDDHCSYDDAGGAGGGGKEWNFSDGVGIISNSMADLIAPEKTAFQIRFAGFKGVLARPPQDLFCPMMSTRAPICFRPSMKKFNSSNRSLEILNCSQYIPCHLNRQVILILSSLKIEDSVFITFQDRMVADLAAMLTDDCRARSVLRRLGLTIFTKNMPPSLPLSCPFMLDILRNHYSRSMLDLQWKSRIFIPKGRIILGIIDETGTLRQDEVFIGLSGGVREDEGDPFFYRYDGDGDGDGDGYIMAPVIVCKNPCMHPGDLRKMRAVASEAHSNFKDVIVFPRQGKRPITDMCSGSDLDGDLYWVSWEPSLQPTSEHPPMSYEAMPAKLLAHPVGLTDINEFIVSFMSNDSLGTIANAHIAHAVQDKDGVGSSICIRLAYLFSMAVDFPKTGFVPQFPAEAKVTKWPDFMGKEECVSYPCASVIGQLFRRIKNLKCRPPIKVGDCDATGFGDGGGHCRCQCSRDILDIPLYSFYSKKMSTIIRSFNLSSEADIFLPTPPTPLSTAADMSITEASLKEALTQVMDLWDTISSMLANNGNGFYNATDILEQFKKATQRRTGSSGRNHHVYNSFRYVLGINQAVEIEVEEETFKAKVGKDLIEWLERDYRSLLKQRIPQNLSLIDELSSAAAITFKATHHTLALLEVEQEDDINHVDLFVEMQKDHIVCKVLPSLLERYKTMTISIKEDSSCFSAKGECDDFSFTLTNDLSRHERSVKLAFLLRNDLSSFAILVLLSRALCNFSDLIELGTCLFVDGLTGSDDCNGDDYNVDNGLKVEYSLEDLNISWSSIDKDVVGGRVLDCLSNHASIPRRANDEMYHMYHQLLFDRDITIKLLADRSAGDESALLVDKEILYRRANQRRFRDLSLTVKGRGGVRFLKGSSMFLMKERSVNEQEPILFHQYRGRRRTKHLGITSFIPTFKNPIPNDNVLSQYILHSYRQFNALMETEAFLEGGLGESKYSLKLGNLYMTNIPKRFVQDPSAATSSTLQRAISMGHRECGTILSIGNRNTKEEVMEAEEATSSTSPTIVEALDPTVSVKNIFKKQGKKRLAALKPISTSFEPGLSEVGKIVSFLKSTLFYLFEQECKASESAFTLHLKEHGGENYQAIVRSNKLVQLRRQPLKWSVVDVFGSSPTMAERDMRLQLSSWKVIPLTENQSLVDLFEGGIVDCDDVVAEPYRSEEVGLLIRKSKKRDIYKLADTADWKDIPPLIRQNLLFKLENVNERSSPSPIDGRMEHLLDKWEFTIDYPITQTTSKDVDILLLQRILWKFINLFSSKVEA